MLTSLVKNGEKEESFWPYGSPTTSADIQPKIDQEGMDSGSLHYLSDFKLDTIKERGRLRSFLSGAALAAALGTACTTAMGGSRTDKAIPGLAAEDRKFLLHFRRATNRAIDRKVPIPQQFFEICPTRLAVIFKDRQ